MRKYKFQHKCLVCNNISGSNKEKPKACPRCKRYDWLDVKTAERNYIENPSGGGMS